MDKNHVKGTKYWSKIYSADRQFLGHLVYLVISQENEKLAKLVLKKGFFDNEQKVVDIQAIAKIYEDGRAVDLSITAKKFTELPLLTTYEEVKSFATNLEGGYPFKKNTRFVTYLPDTVSSAEEGNDGDTQITGRFMKRVQIYSDQFILLGGNSLFSFGDNKKNGTIHKITFEFSDGKVESINLRQGLPFLPNTEFQVPFKLTALNRMDKSILQFN